MKRKFVFTGGGTGGHVTPAIAISEALRDLYPESEFRYVGKAGKVEERMVPKEWSAYSSAEQTVRFVSTTSGSLKSPKVLFQLGLGFVQAAAFLIRFRPDAIVATGGYVSAPIVFASGLLRKLKLLNTKLLVHEANAELGRMNAAALRFADKVAVSFPGTKVPQSKKVFVGYPVRKRLVVEESSDKATSQVEARQNLNLPSDAKVVFAFGGSQGARTINRGIVDSLPLLLTDPKVYILHGTGKKMPGSAYYGKDDVKARLTPDLIAKLPSDWEERYRYTDFIDNMGEYYAATDLVICRGGAGSLVEVCANAIASITIPKANLPGDHQAVNARVLEQLGATKVVYERVDIASGDSVESIEPTELAELVFDLLSDPERRKEMGRAARTQYDSETSQLCAQIIGGLLEDGDLPESKPEPELKSERILGSSDSKLESLLAAVRLGKAELTDVERQLVLYKLDGMSASSSLVSPARACRMFGLGQFTERLDVLLNFARNPNKSPFTRRDACKGLGNMGVLNDQVLECLVSVAQKDSYFEAVNEALYSLYKLFRTNASTGGLDVVSVQTLAQDLSHSREFDIRMNALGLLALLCSDFSEIREPFEANYFHPNWQVRKRIVECLAELQKDGRIEKGEVEDILNNRFLQTSNGFDTHFQLKEEIIQVYQQESREAFVKEFKSVIYSGVGTEEKSTQLQSLSGKAKEQGLELGLHDVLDEVKNAVPQNHSLVDFYREQIKRHALDKNKLRSLKTEILQHKEVASLQDVLDTIEFLLGDESHVVFAR